MRRGLLLGFAAALAVASTPTQALATGSIAGTLTDASNEAPIPNTRVCALKTTEDVEDRCTTTTESGGYFLSLLPSGTYRVQFAPTYSDSDYLMRFYDEKPSFEEADFVSVTSGTTTGVDAQLQEGGRIEGTVIDAFSKAPVAGIEVCARRAADDSFVRCAHSDEDGLYELSGLPTDSYKVSFYAPDEDLNYIEQFYKGKSFFAGATPVAVTAGVSVANIDAELQPGAKIEGNVTDAETGTEVEGVEVCVYTSGTNEFVECTQTDAAGNYKIARLRTGSYKVGFLPQYNNLNYKEQYYDGKPSLEAAATLPLAVGEAATGIDAELQKASRIEGTAIDAVSAEPISYLEVCAYRASDGEQVRCTHTDPEGEYALAGLAGGDYKVGFFSINYEEGTTGQNYVAQYYNSKSSLQSAEPVSVPDSTDVTGIDAEMQEGERIKGTVIDAESKEAIHLITVCAVKVGDTTAERCANTGYNGEYAITALAPGEYKVEFVDNRYEPLYPTRYYDGKLSLAAADPISVTIGPDVTGIDAEMQEGGRIEGLLTESSSGEPTEGVEVCALKPDGSLVRCTWAEEAGAFAIGALNGGSYKVVFSPESELFGEEYEGEFETRYYDEKESLAEADLVEVSAATATTGIDGVLTRTSFAEAPTSTEAPQLTGGPAVGEVLSCSPGSWENNPLEYAYEWLRDGDPIDGQISNAYAVQAADQGHAIACAVTAVNEYGSTSATSNALSVPPVSTQPPGDQGTPGSSGGGGGGGGGGAPATLTPPPSVVKPLKCKKGFRKKTVHGKARCMRRHKRRRTARTRPGPDQVPALYERG